MKVGDLYEEIITYTQEQVNAFAQLTGDKNPIHLDNEYAKSTIFKVPIIHGMLGASVFSKILGTIFPGEGTIYSKQSLNFTAPMFVGINYKVLITILEINAEKGSAKLSTSIFNEEQHLVTSGEAVVYNKIFKS